MREIKFRVWLENPGVLTTKIVMIHPETERVSVERDVLPKSKAFDATTLSGEVVYWYGKNGGGNHLMHWTGLKDKNDKEIWEGDIVKIDDGDGWELGIDVIHFLDGRFECKEDNSIQLDGRITEVIGNIYENKDLLK